jgi:hypothetical protein
MSLGNAVTVPIRRTITQTAHGFTAKQWVYISAANTYGLADANGTYPSNRAIGIVDSVTDANTFVLQTDGYVTGLTGLTAGARHYVATTPGAISIAVPTTATPQVMLIADSTTSGYMWKQQLMSNSVASPEGVISGSRGELHWDSSNLELYVKDSGTNTNTGWVVATPAAQYANITRGSTGTIFTAPATSGGDNPGTVQNAAQRIPFTTAGNTGGSSSSAGFTINANAITVNAAGAGTLEIHVDSHIPTGNRVYMQLVKNSATVLTSTIALNSSGNTAASLTYIGTFVATDTIDVRYSQGPSAQAVGVGSYSVTVKKL